MFNKAFFLAFYSSARLLGYLLSGRFRRPDALNCMMARGTLPNYRLIIAPWMRSPAKPGRYRSPGLSRASPPRSLTRTGRPTS